MTVTSWPRCARPAANDPTRFWVAPASGGKYCEASRIRTSGARVDGVADVEGRAHHRRHLLHRPRLLARPARRREGVDLRAVALVAPPVDRLRGAVAVQLERPEVVEHARAPLGEDLDALLGQR